MSQFELQDELNHPRTETPEFTQMAERGLSRRRFLGATAALGAVTFFSMTPVSRSIAAALSPTASSLLGFKSCACEYCGHNCGARGLSS